MIGRCFSNYKRLPLKDGPRIFQGMGKERRRRSNGNVEVFIVDQVGFKHQWCEEGHLAASPNTGFFSFLGPNGTVLPINYGCSQSLLDSVFLGVHPALLNSCSSLLWRARHSPKQGDRATQLYDFGHVSFIHPSIHSCVCACTCHGVPVKGRRQLVRICSILLPIS